MPTNPALYPRWERHGHLSRFYLGPGLPIYEVEKRALLGGALFVACAVDTAELVGQFESEYHAQRACARGTTPGARRPDELPQGPKTANPPRQRVCPGRGTKPGPSAGTKTSRCARTATPSNRS
jgi:hypothetical protein